jgi:uncharacterized protein
VHLSGLFIYPVKSLRGCAVDSAEVDALGLVGDRRFLLIDGAGRFLTQRTLPRMALIATALAGGRLTLSADGAGDVKISTAPDDRAPLRPITIWKSEGLLAEDCGDEPSRWLSDFLRVGCRLVRIGGAFRRPILKPGVALPGDLLHFGDGAPFLAIGEASLADLNDRLAARGEMPVPMDRFRPNLVVSGSPPFAEDGWPRFRIGAIAFRAAGACKRCILTTVDQLTAERGDAHWRAIGATRSTAPR